MASETDSDSILARAETLITEGRSDQAWEVLRGLLSSDSQDVGVLKAAGRVLNNLGRIDEAADALGRAVRLAPADGHAHAILGHVLARQGDDPGAEASWRRALQLDPDQPQALKGLARLCARSGRMQEAVSCLENVSASAPEDADNWLNLAELYQFLESPGQAEAAFRQVIGREPDRVDAHAGLAKLLFSGGATRRAATAFRRALELDPDQAELAAGLAVCLDVFGERPEGLALLERWLSSNTGGPAVDYAAGRLLLGLGKEQEALESLQRATGSEDPRWHRNPAAWYWLGAVLDRLARHEEAFDAWTQANTLKPARFDTDEFRRRVSAIASAPWKSAAGREAIEGGVDRPRPVFIVGMPRSGTTLVEQILACHPQVQPGGERLDLEEIARQMWADQERLEPASEAEAQGLCREWMRSYGPVREGHTRFTDKYPGNFMHVGLVARLMPDAFVVWCRRDPGDTALSIYANDFNRTLLPWATRLEHIAEVWKAQEQLMSYWRRVLDLPILDVCYEALVEDPEGQVRRLLEFLKLPWEPACLRFHENARLANTASFDQVRQPLYTTAIGRHLRFGDRLKAFFEAVAD